MCIHLLNPPAPNCADATGCGNCQCVPPFWKTTAQVLPGQHPTYEQILTGTHIIPRVSRLQGGPSPCTWYLPANVGIGVSPIDPTPGIYVYNPTGAPTAWLVVLQYGHPLSLPLDVAAYSQVAFGFPRVTWRCLFPNRLYLDSLGGNLIGMPNYIDVEPFWP
jgi:hypothetical protein